MKDTMTKYTIPRFWNSIKKININEHSEFDKIFFNSVKELALFQRFLLKSYDDIFSYDENLKKQLINDEFRKKHMYMRRSIEKAMWNVVAFQNANSFKSFDSPALNFNNLCFKIFDKLFQQYSNGEIDLNDEPFIDFCKHLHSLGLFVKIEEIIFEVLQTSIERKIDEMCKGVFEGRLLSQIIDWVKETCVVWVKSILEHDNLNESNIIDEINSLTPDLSQDIIHRDVEKDSLKEKLAQWESRLVYFVYESFGNLRIKELFDIIIDFPESKDSLLDLKDCLLKTKAYNKLIDVLKASFKKRLLHPGANTSDILSAYISSIKSLYIIDKNGILHMNACKVVEEYLKTRNDSIRCIVSSMIDEENENTLFEELEKTEPYEEDEEDEAWKPNPRTTLISNSAENKESLDIINLIVKSLEDKEELLNEYGAMLAERLLRVTDFDVEKEIRNVELLKVKFGETSLNQCEAMIKDITDSKRLHSYIHKNEDLFSSTIISYLFWPLQLGEKSDIHLPKFIEEKIKHFSDEYTKLKASRKLEWHKDIGIVELELEFNDGDVKLDFSVTPLQATVLLLFQEEDKSQLTKDDIIKLTGIKEDQIQKILRFWMANGIITEEDGFYSVVETYNEEGPTIIEEEEDQVIQEEDEDNSELENYVIAMIKNLGKLPLQRIHQMMVNVNSEYSKTALQMQNILQKMVQEEKLELIGNEYALK